MVIAAGGGDAGQKHSLQYRHAFEIDRVIALQNRINPVEVAQTESWIIVGRLPEINPGESGTDQERGEQQYPKAWSTSAAESMGRAQARSRGRSRAESQQLHKKICSTLPPRPRTRSRTRPSLTNTPLQRGV